MRRCPRASLADQLFRIALGILHGMAVEWTAGSPIHTATSRFRPPLAQMALVTRDRTEPTGAFPRAVLSAMARLDPTLGSQTQ